MGIAIAAAQRSTCPRAKVGAVIVTAHDDIVGVGFNGAPIGKPHCTEVGCHVEDDHCLRTVHAELNALIRAGRLARGATIYTTCFPCRVCAQLIINAHIKRAVYAEDYHGQGLQDFGIHYLKTAGITVQKLGGKVWTK